MENYEQVKLFIERLSNERVHSGDFGLGVLDDDRRNEVRVDLDGILDSTNEFGRLFRSLSVEDTNDQFENFLVNFEIHLEHMLKHWMNLTEALRSKDLWFDANEAPFRIEFKDASI